MNKTGNANSMQSTKAQMQLNSERDRQRERQSEWVSVCSCKLTLPPNWPPWGHDKLTKLSTLWSGNVSKTALQTRPPAKKRENVVSGKNSRKVKEIPSFWTDSCFSRSSECAPGKNNRTIQWWDFMWKKKNLCVRVCLCVFCVCVCVCVCVCLLLSFFFFQLNKELIKHWPCE